MLFSNSKLIQSKAKTVSLQVLLFFVRFRGDWGSAKYIDIPTQYELIIKPYLLN